jgi:di/tricarboxylate transporter
MFVVMLQFDPLSTVATHLFHQNFENFVPTTHLVPGLVRHSSSTTPRLLHRVISISPPPLHLFFQMFQRFLHGGDDGEGDDYPAETSVFYKIVATLVFIFMSFNLFFPFNSIFPLDRRTASAIAGTLCYVTRAFLFPDKPMDLVEAVDWDVIILLAGIMCINYIMVNQKETKNVVDYVQDQIKNSPKNGFWLVNTSAFIVSPFLTNDGVCLLFVEPILAAFEAVVRPMTGSSHGSANGSAHGSRNGGSSHGDSGHGGAVDLNDPTAFVLEQKDAIYFLLGLACSSNIGSALTYTGNPQVPSLLSFSLFPHSSGV